MERAKWSINDNERDKETKTIFVNPNYCSLDFKSATYHVISPIITPDNVKSCETSFELNVDELNIDSMNRVWQIVITGYRKYELTFLYDVKFTANRYENTGYKRTKVDVYSINDSVVLDDGDYNVFLPHVDILASISYKSDGDDNLTFSIDKLTYFTYTTGMFPIDKLECRFAVLHSPIWLAVKVIKDIQTVSIV